MNNSLTLPALPAEVLAVILPDATVGSEHRPRYATVLLRNADGRLEVRTLPTRDVLADRRMRRGCVRPGTPILDPTSHEVVGYEMVQAAG